MPTYANQQRDPRVPFEQPVWVGVRDTTGPIRRLWAANLSKGGMFVKTPEPLALGAEVLVALEGTDEILPLAEARVVWQRSRQESSPAGVGLAFTELRPSAKSVLEELIQSHGAKEPALESSAWPEPVTPTLLPPAAGPSSSADAGHEASPLPAVLEAFWTELFLPRRARIRVRLLAGELRLDFGPDTRLEAISRDGNAVLIYLGS